MPHANRPKETPKMTTHTERLVLEYRKKYIFIGPYSWRWYIHKYKITKQKSSHNGTGSFFAPARMYETKKPQYRHFVGG